MKTIVLIAAFAFSGVTFAQKISEAKIPTAVLTTFKTKFPAADKVAWEMENNSEYEADFTIDGKKKSATFLKSGQWKQTEVEIPLSELPKAVTEAIAANFSGFKTEEAEKAETANGTAYEVKIKKGKLAYDVMVAGSGKVLKKMVNKDANQRD